MGTFEVVEAFKQDINEEGYAVAALVGDVTGCDWAYSMGLEHNFGHPELIIVGVDAPVAGAIVQALGAKVVAGVDLRTARNVRVGPITVELRPVDDLFCSQGDWFNLGREVLTEWGERWPETLQIVWADADGRFPERSDDPSWFRRQPLLAGQR